MYFIFMLCKCVCQAVFFPALKKWIALRYNLCGHMGGGFSCLGSIFFTPQVFKIPSIMSAGPEFKRSVMIKQGLPRKVGALWSDWKLKLVSSHQFGGSLPCAGMCCTVGKQKAHGKEGLRKMTSLPKGGSVRQR